MTMITQNDTDMIKEWLNCETADVDSEGDVWVQGPMTGHWIDESAKAEYLEWRKDVYGQ